MGNPMQFKGKRERIQEKKPTIVMDDLHIIVPRREKFGAENETRTRFEYGTESFS